MPSRKHVLSREEMLELYGAFYNESPKTSIDPSRVPKAVHPLIPYAEFWGLADDFEREELIYRAPRRVLSNLAKSVDSLIDELEAWLAGDEANSPDPSDEYVAFS